MVLKKPIELHPKKILDRWAIMDGIDAHNHAVTMEQVDRVIQETERRIKSGQLKNEPLPILDLADEDLLISYL